MKEWWRETHGSDFELLRHFLGRFFDSDLVTARGHAATLLIWAFAMIAPWFLIFARALAGKYRVLSTVGSPSDYLTALRADELWLLTLTMSSIGLLAAVKWQSLFPDRRDYYALGSLPLRARQIFTAKLAALLLVTTAAVIVIDSLPSLLFPLVSGGRWALQPSVTARIAAHAGASVAGSYFLFFALVGLQGLLLNLVPPRWFAGISSTVQGLAAGAMLFLMVLSFSIGPPVARWLEHSPAAAWLPPVWFLGLYQSAMGDADPLMRRLALRGEAALAIAVGVALASYLASYRRHRDVALEAAAGARDRRWPGVLLDWIVPGPRRQAIVVFMWRTMARSGPHRMILIAYAGLGLAVAATGFLGIGEVFHSSKALAAYFVYGHMILLIFLLLGAKHLFSVPAELRANWTFQITEREGRDEWLEAVDGSVLATGAAVLLALPFPYEARVIGWRAFGEAALFAAIAMVAYEWLFSEWRKLPFTCSRLPGKTPLWITFLYGLGLVTFVPIFNSLIVLSLYSGAGFTVVLVLAFSAWRRIRSARREAWGDLRLIYDEAPDPAIHGLHLLQ